MKIKNAWWSRQFTCKPCTSKNTTAVFWLCNRMSDVPEQTRCWTDHVEKTNSVSAFYMDRQKIVMSKMSDVPEQARYWTDNLESMTSVFAFYMNRQAIVMRRRVDSSKSSTTGRPFLEEQWERYVDVDGTTKEFSTMNKMRNALRLPPSRMTSAPFPTWWQVRRLQCELSIYGLDSCHETWKTGIPRDNTTDSKALMQLYGQIADPCKPDHKPAHNIFWKVNREHVMSMDEIQAPVAISVFVELLERQEQDVALPQCGKWADDFLLS